MRTFSFSNKMQSGAVLVVSLIILLLMTIIGVTAMQTTVLEEKMAGNTRDLSAAFDASESALRVGERWIDGLTPPKPDPVAACTAPCNQTVWDLVAALDPTSGASTWDTANVRAAYATPVIPAVATQPEYYVEHELFAPDSLNLGTHNDNAGRDLYRVTARGTGGTATTQAIMRTTYARRF